LKERDHSEDRNVDGTMGSEWILGRLAEGEGVKWIQLAQDRDRWLALVNTVMNIWVSFQALIFRSLFMKNTVKLSLELSSIFLDGISFVQCIFIYLPLHFYSNHNFLIDISAHLPAFHLLFVPFFFQF
jgi:hypothetical protein